MHSDYFMIPMQRYVQRRQFNVLSHVENMSVKVSTSFYEFFWTSDINILWWHILALRGTSFQWKRHCSVVYFLVYFWQLVYHIDLH